MRRAFATLLLLLCATCEAGAQAAEEGIKYTSPEGRYSVRLPKEPQVGTQDVTTPAGIKAKQFYAGASDGASVHLVLYFDYDADEVFSLDNARDGVLSRVKGTLVSERAVSLGGHPGKELRVLSKDPEGLEISARMRYYDVERRIYVLQCISPKSADGPELTAKCDKFFDSFKVEAAK